MERDFNRYMVIKMSHAEHALTKEERDLLWKLGMKVAKWRRAEGRTPFECLVVEHDWPEYEPVWQSIEARVDNPDDTMSLYLLNDKALEHIESSTHDAKEYARGIAEANKFYSKEQKRSYLKGIGPYCNGWNYFMTHGADYYG